MRKPLLLSAITLSLSLSAVAAEPKVHQLRATPTTVHRSFFDASLPPVLTIDSGDIVQLETVSGNPRWFQEVAGVPKEQIPKELFEAFEGVEGNGRGDHTLNGPIAVRGAEPGDMLEIRIRSVDVRLPLAGQGIVPGKGVLPEQFPYSRPRALWIDMKRRVIPYGPGVEVPLHPFWGVMGVAPPATMGRVPSGAPNIFGGNMDNRDLGAGSTLYLPVHATGGLLSIGDGHAAQGEGEVCVSAVEASLKGEIQVILHKNQPMRWPRAETATDYMSIGLDPDLNQAAKIATSEMLDFLVSEKGMNRDDAYLMSSAALNLIVTQAVDGTKGVHALLPKSIFTKK